MNIYTNIAVYFNGRSAKNKAIIGCGKVHILKLEARDDDEAYRLACLQILPNDKRPVAGKSYIRCYRAKLRGAGK